MKAVIQAGGRGTRISAITENIIPKPMLEISGYPILYHQIMNLKKSGITDIIIIIGFLGEYIEDYFKDGSSFGLKISYIKENPNIPLGTAGSLYDLKAIIHEDFIFLLADIFIDIDFNRMIKYHKEKKAVITLLTHPNSHPHDSDLIVTNSNGVVLSLDSKTNDRTNYNYHNKVNSGVMIFSPKALTLLQKKQPYNYEEDIIKKLIPKGSVFAYSSSEYVKDAGTPERYFSVKKDFKIGLTKIRNYKNKQKCIFLDRDGTINEYVGFLTKENELSLIDGVAEAIKKINNSEYLCIVITNQPVIARGEVTFEELENINMKLEKLLGEKGAYIDGLYYCPHHPDKGFEGEIKELKFDCNCRKPNIGLILDAVKDFNIDIKQSIFIGDSTIDIKTAENSNMKSILLKTGQAGKDGKYDVHPTYIAKNLLDAVDNYILKEKENI